MTTTKTNYSANITIALPSDVAASWTVTLLPEDSVELENGRFLSLADCTVADLRQFAEMLEADVWREYDNINLLDLKEDETVDVDVKKKGHKKKQVNLKKAYILLPDLEIDGEAEMDVDELLAEEAETVVEETSAAKVDAVAVELVEDEVAVEESADIPSPNPAPEESPADVLVEESEDIHPEKELAEDEEPTIVVPETVRLMGKTRPLGHGTSAACDILINEDAFRHAQEHSLTSLRKEVAGMLIGPQPEKQPDGRYIVHITDCIIAKHTEMRSASVTYTPESWRYIHDELRRMYPDDTHVIVGWYHTHPGFGIFLSGMDLFIHNNFFTQKWHLALVLDPVGRTSGFFGWDRQQSEVERYQFPWPTWAARGW